MKKTRSLAHLLWIQNLIELVIKQDLLIDNLFKKLIEETSFEQSQYEGFKTENSRKILEQKIGTLSCRRSR